MTRAITRFLLQNPLCNLWGNTNFLLALLPAGLCDWGPRSCLRTIFCNFPIYSLFMLISRGWKVNKQRSVREVKWLPTKRGWNPDVVSLVEVQHKKQNQWPMSMLFPQRMEGVSETFLESKICMLNVFVFFLNNKK